MIRITTPLALLLALAACTSQPGAIVSPPAPDTPIRLATWNLEFLAEKDGDGCAPRVPADYAAMRRIAEGLDADVIAFQEAENVAAAARVFDPARFTIVMEARPGAPSGTCGGKNPGQKVVRQAVGFAVRKGVAFDRNADVTSLMLGNAQLRSGVDITLRPKGKVPIRLLSIHLKSGCFAGSAAKACPVLIEQIPALEAWIDAAAQAPDRFAVLGDWNQSASTASTADAISPSPLRLSACPASTRATRSTGAVAARSNISVILGSRDNRERAPGSCRQHRRPREVPARPPRNGLSSCR